MNQSIENLGKKQLCLGFTSPNNVSSNCLFTPTDLPAISSPAYPVFDTDLIPQEDRLLQKLLLARRQIKTWVPLKKGQGEEFLPVAL